MTTHPTPAPGDIWHYHWGGYKTPRSYHVFVIKWDDDENAYECLTLETGVIDYWMLDIEGDPDVWRKVS